MCVFLAPLIAPRRPSFLLLRSPSSPCRSIFSSVFLFHGSRLPDHAWQCMVDDYGPFLRRVSLFKFTFSTMSLLNFRLLWMTSFLMRSCLVTPAMRLKQLISNTLNLLHECRHQFCPRGFSRPRAKLEDYSTACRPNGHEQKPDKPTGMIHAPLL